MRIAFFHQSADLYGSDKVLLALVTALPKRGVEPIVLLPSTGPLSIALERANISVKYVPVLKIARSTLTPAGIVRLLQQVPRTLSAIDSALGGISVDLVHSNTLAVLAGAIWARRRGIPHVWHVHEIIQRPWLARTVLPLLVRLLSDMTVCNSRATQDWLLSEQPQLAQRSIVIWNGVTPPKAVDTTASVDLTSVSSGGEACVVIGLVGRMNRWKGHELLIEAGEILSARGRNDFSIVFVGSPVAGHEDIRTALKARIARSTISQRISLVDFQEDIWPIWNAIDICCVPSTDPEPFGLVAVEAMALGKSVVAASHGGLPEVVEHGVSGLLFKPNSAIALADALSSLIADRPLRIQMGAAAQQLVSRKFSAEAMAEAFFSCYRKVLHKKTFP